jgi:thiamine biosynthesis lipoprotein
VRLTALLAVAGCAVLAAHEVRLKPDTIADREGPRRGAGLYAPRTAVLVSRDVYLMGTRARLSVHAVHREDGLAKLDAALAALEDTEEELSTWRESSEISALNRQAVGQPWTATGRLCRMFADVRRWHQETGGAFDPAIGRLLGAWDAHGEGAIPSPAAHARALASSGMALLAFDETACTLTRRGDVAVDAGAFGKGEGLDRAAAALGGIPWMIDLGGQISVGGAAPPEGGWTIAIAHPRQRELPVLHVRMTRGSLSTSAGSERDMLVNGRRVGHILDPRTGHPAEFIGSVAVWHDSGLAADALSTALYVMGPDAGLRWARQRGLAACFLIPEGATVRMDATAAFRQLITGRG